MRSRADRRSPGRRFALALVAGLMVVLFVALSAAAALNGQVFLAVFGAIGGLMTAWALAASFGRA